MKNEDHARTTCFRARCTWVPGKSGPNRCELDPTLTFSAASSFSCSIHVYSTNLPPSPSLIGLQPDSCWQLSPPPEKLNELEKFPSINCTKSFAAGGATFLWENQSSSDAKKYHPTLNKYILTGILLSYAIFTSRINAKMWDASETVKICIY